LLTESGKIGTENRRRYLDLMFHFSKNL
jgi:hypothetical protein